MPDFFPKHKQLRVLLSGDSYDPSSPNKALADGLERAGVKTLYRPDFPHSGSTGDWIRFLKSVDAIVHIEYRNPDDYSAKRLALAAALNKPVVRRWVGTDVLLALKEPEIRAKAKLLDRIVAASTTSAPHLAAELESVRIKARFIPSPVRLGDSRTIQIINEVPRAVLVYLPTKRIEFYGGPIVRDVARRNPDIEFVIVADESHSLADLPNVSSLGWVSDMEPVYRRVGCVMRITEHDGLPRIVTEALLRGRYAIHNRPLEGCWFARNADEAHEKLLVLRHIREPNVKGAKAISALYNPAPEHLHAELLRNLTSQVDMGKRMSGLRVAVSLMARAKLRKLRNNGHEQ